MSGVVNATRLKELIMTHSPTLQCHTDGQNSLLAFDKDNDDAISIA